MFRWLSHFDRQIVPQPRSSSEDCSYNWEFVVNYFLNLPLCKTAVEAYIGPSTPEVVTWEGPARLDVRMGQ